ncbi:MAG: hypothetical protein RBS57_14275 [Desulforhabdus sp.]|jgi:flagellar motility protein MotE (MotC chaperone)|nr:hypothetical protein [Desulforhabdus sp.]
MKKNCRKRFIAWTVLAFLVFSLLSIKLGLSLGRFVLHSTESTPSVLTSEVHAADPSTKPQLTHAQTRPVGPIPGTPTTGSPGQSDQYSVPDMMSHLQQKEAELKRKEEQLQQREEYLAKMKQEVDDKLKELIDLQKEVQAYRTEKQEDQNAQIRSLSKIYGSMKPKEAAKLLENLDDKLVVSIISTMNATDAANILANMDIKKAAKISESLSQRK